MEKQTARQKVVTAAVGKIFRSVDGSGGGARWQTAIADGLCVDRRRDEEPRAVGDAGRFPELVVDSPARVPRCAGCDVVVGLSWATWRQRCEMLPGRGHQFYAICEGCRSRDQGFKELMTPRRPCDGSPAAAS